MNTSAPQEGTVWSGLAVLLRTFAARAQNWVILARNLIPVVGVYLLGWSMSLTAFAYWFDGICMVAMIVIACAVRAPEKEFRSAPWHKVPLLVVLTVLCAAFAFFLLAIPYWMAYGALGLDGAVDEIQRNRNVALSFFGMLAGIVVRSFLHGGYMTLSIAQLAERWQPDMYNLGARAFAMLVIIGWHLEALVVPLIALLLAGIEIWPTLRDDLFRPERR